MKRQLVKTIGIYSTILAVTLMFLGIFIPVSKSL